MLSRQYVWLRKAHLFYSLNHLCVNFGLCSCCLKEYICPRDQSKLLQIQIKIPLLQTWIPWILYADPSQAPLIMMYVLRVIFCKRRSTNAIIIIITPSADCAHGKVAPRSPNSHQQLYSTTVVISKLHKHLKTKQFSLEVKLCPDSSLSSTQ